MNAEVPSGQETALLLAELRELKNEVRSIKRVSKEKDEKIDQMMGAIRKRDKQIDELMEQIRNKDAKIKEMTRKMDRYASEIRELREEKRGRKGKTILQSMLAYTKEHPYLVASAVAAGVLVGFLSFYGVPAAIIGVAAASGKTAIANGCVVGGTILLVGDLFKENKISI